MLGFVSGRKDLKKHFSQKLKQIFDTRIKGEKGAYLRLIGYDTLFVTRSKPVDKRPQILRKHETERYIQNLYKEDNTGAIDILFWRKLPFDKKCLKKFDSRINRQYEVADI